MKLINIGFGNMVSASRVIAIISPESAPIKRIIQEAGAERVSDAAVVALVEYLEADAAAVAKKAIEYAKIAKRQTVKADDIALAIDKE